VAISDGIDMRGEKIRALFEADGPRRDEATRSFALAGRGAPEPSRMAEYDPELFELHAQIEPRVVPPPANGHDLSGGER